VRDGVRGADRALVLTGGWQTDRERAYVSLSRVRERTDVYVSREHPGETGSDNYLAALTASDDAVGIAYADVSTGRAAAALSMVDAPVCSVWSVMLLLEPGLPSWT